MPDCSFLGFLLGLGLLLLVFLVGSFTSVDVFESLELFNEEGSHDLVSDLTSSEDTTVSSRNGSSGGVQSLEIVWSGNFNTLHVGASGVLFDKMKDEFAS